MQARTRRKCALIVGASRGLGLGLVREYLARGWDVIATARDEKGDAALAALAAAQPSRLSVLRMDVTMPADIAAAMSCLGPERLDVLFVNAGISGDPDAAVETVSEEDFAFVMRTNAHAPLEVVSGLLSAVKTEGTVAVMSSNMGSVSGNHGMGWELYRASKAALNQLMRSFHARQADRRTYLVVSPGWVRTDMGGSDAPLSVEESVRGMIETLDLRRGRAGIDFVDYANRDVPW
ncbi:SDR family NAD(P)-dependent oxidoreductase [Ensifer soli]|uniref:SDR family NAD(P)-dependent oxidoreductase n=1 Tax=Ciceribacter sp. sgz301302 TaxID=3342379 RepID=UPI0035BB3447